MHEGERLTRLLGKVTCGQVSKDNPAVNLHPHPRFEPISVRQAIGLDGWIEYRRDYRPGHTLWFHHEFSRPCITIRKVQSDWRMVISGERRMFTAAELAAICGFPPAFRFVGGQSAVWQRVGNAVPPPFMRSIAARIQNSLARARD